jgi:hypothetical protein
MTYFVILAFVAIVGSLGAALFFMLRRDVSGTDKSRRMARALGIRVALSITLLLCILLAWHLGYIQPTGIAPGR